MGVAIFLTAMVFTFAFAPGMLTPFTKSGQQDTVTVDRVANQVGQDTLGSPARPYVLDRHCTVEFFNRSNPDDTHTAPTGSADCRWDDGTLYEQLGLKDRANVNVTIKGNLTGGTASEILFWNGDDRRFEEMPGASSSNDVPLQTGDVPPERNDATVSATRVAGLNETDVTIEVILW